MGERPKRRVLRLRVEVDDDRTPETLYELLSEGMDALGATDEEHPHVVRVDWGQWTRYFGDPTPSSEES